MDCVHQHLEVLLFCVAPGYLIWQGEVAAVQHVPRLPREDAQVVLREAAAGLAHHLRCQGPAAPGAF